MSKSNRSKAFLTTFVAGAIFSCNMVQAAPITGDFTISGAFLPMVDATTQGTFLTANAIDFVDPAAPTTGTPGVPGIISVTGATGDFAALLPIGTQGTAVDFAFGGSAFLPNFPAPPIAGFQQFGIANVSVDLLNVSLTRRTDMFLDLRGTTTVHAPQYSNTAGTFNFSGVTGANSTFTFSAVNSVPEPKTLALLGLGLLGLGLARRRKR